MTPNTLVDGEIVAPDENGGNSFNLLQHHGSEASGIAEVTRLHLCADDTVNAPSRSVSAIAGRPSR